MKDYLKLLRVKHYIKNFLVFVPLFFGGEMLSISKMGTACGNWKNISHNRIIQRWF